MIYEGANDTSGCHLAVFSEDVDLVYHFVVPHPSPLSYRVGVLVVLATLVRMLSKIVGYTASYPFNSWYIDYVRIYTQNSC